MQNVFPHIVLEKITDVEVRSAMVFLLNSFETALQTIDNLKKENAELKKENAILKGEQGKPDIKHKVQNTNISSEKQYQGEKKKTQKTSRQNKIKAHKINIDNIVICAIDKATLPADAINKGYERIISQNIIFKSDNTEYRCEKYYSPSLKKTFIAPLPSDYSGYIASDLKTLCQIFHHSWDITRSKLISGLATIGIDLSDGMLNKILFEPAPLLIKEKDAILQAGLAGVYTQIDGTSALVHGEKCVTQIICSPDFTVFTTMAQKSRLHILFALQGEPEDGLQYAYNKETEKYLQHFKVSNDDKEILKNRFTGQPIITELEFHQIISKEYPALFAKTNMYKRVCESFAFGYYFTQKDYPIIDCLVSDDAKEYKMIATETMLCWVHDARYYNKLTPRLENHRTILNDFKERYWKFYHSLLDYKTYPSSETAIELDTKFDELFVPTTDYDGLNNEICRTKNNKSELLTVLKHPLLPLHNNLAELKARVLVRKRDISLHTMSELGTKVKDAMMSIIQTATQLGVNVWKYIADLLNQENDYSLADLIYANQYNSS